MYYYIISKCSTNKISGPKTITNLPWIFICLEIVVLVFFQDRDYCAFRTNISNKVNRRVIFSILAKPIYNTISHTYHHLPKVNFIFCKFTLGHRLHNLGQKQALIFFTHGIFRVTGLQKFKLFMHTNHNTTTSQAVRSPSLLLSLALLFQIGSIMSFWIIREITKSIYLGTVKIFFLTLNRCCVCVYVFRVCSNGLISEHL